VGKWHFGWVAALIVAAVTCVERPSVRAADGPGSEALKQHGLKMAGSVAVAELEADVKNKLNEARRLLKQLSQSLTEQQAIVSPKERERNMKTLNDEINQLKSEINAVNQQMAQVPRNTNQNGGTYGGAYGGLGGYRGGLGGYGGIGGYGSGLSGFSGGFANNTAAEEYQELLAYRNQLQEELRQDTRLLNQMQNQVTDPKSKDKVDAEVRQRRDSYHQALLDLRKTVDATTAKYEEAAKSDEITKALKLVGKSLREKPKLGPSREFLTNVKLVEKLEKAESSGEIEEPQARRSRRSRNKTKGKPSPKAAVAAPAPETAGNSEGEPSP
jgi:hypothetical protein